MYYLIPYDILRNYMLMYRFLTSKKRQCLRLSPWGILISFFPQLIAICWHTEKLLLIHLNESYCIESNSHSLFLIKFSTYLKSLQIQCNWKGFFFNIKFTKFTIFFFSFLILWLHSQHMEVPVPQLRQLVDLGWVLHLYLHSYPSRCSWILNPLNHSRNSKFYRF